MALIQRKQARSDNSWFVGVATIPTIIALGSTKINVTVTPQIAGDVLAAAEPVTPHALTTDLPSGILVGQARAIGTNQVQLTVYALVAVTVSVSVSMTFIAQR